MLESMNSSQLEYRKLTPEEMQSRGILGRLVGVCADFMAPTRNGRKYGQELWEKVFSDPIMKERIENGVCFGELNHPFDGREETDIEKAAVCLAEVPKKGKDGKLRAVFDILSTPAGKILKTLCDYGSTLGVSSRGSGDLFTDYDGQESVDPDSYTCEGFDIVAIPAVKAARLQYVNESLDTSKKRSLRESLDKLVEDANDEEKEIMKDTINGLDFGEEDVDNYDKQEVDFQNKIADEDIPEEDTEEVPMEDEIPSEEAEIPAEMVDDEDEPEVVMGKTFKVNYKFPQNDNEFYFISNDCIDKEDAEKRAKEEIGDDIEIVSSKQINELHIEESLDAEDSEKVDEAIVPFNAVPQRSLLIRALNRFNTTGKYAEQGNWKIAKGDDNLDFEICYKNEPVVDCVAGELNEIGDIKDYGISYDKLCKVIQEVYPDCKVIKAMQESLDNETKIEEENESMNEAFDETLPMEGYDCYSYYDSDFRGLEDSYTTNDYEEMKDWAWEHYQKGGSVLVTSRKSGDQVALSPEDIDDEGNYIADTIDDPSEWLNDMFAEFFEDEVSKDDKDGVNAPQTKGDKHIEVAKDKEEASNAGSETVEALQEALKQNRQLEKDKIELQEKLSVCYAKEAKQDEQISGLKKSVQKMSEETKKVEILQNRVSQLTEKLTKSEETINLSKENVVKLNEKLKVERGQRQSLKEDASNRVVQLRELKEQLETSEKEHDETVNSLNESINGLKKDLEQTRTNYSQKLEKSNKLVEKYKKVAVAAADRYIDSQALRLGVNANEIKNKLPENYSFDDIDSICESLQSYKLNMSRLPFRTSTGLNENVKGSIKTSAKEAPVIPADYNDADEVDDMLKSLAGM